MSERTDVVVVGSGAGALSAAISAAQGGCSVLVLEGADLVGGTTAFGGGGVWIPCNDQMAGLGVEDSREDALAYIRAVAGDEQLDDALVETYVDRCNEALSFLAQHSPLRFVASRWFSDYYAECEGSRPGARTMEPAPFDSREQLGDWHDRVRSSPHFPPLTLDEMSGAEEITGGATGTVGLSPELKALADRRRAEGIRTVGESLAATLLRGALDQGVEVRTGVRVRSLLQDDDGRVTGVQTGDGERVDARLGVVVATGGFEWNPDMVRAFLGVQELWPASPPTNVGDGLAMGMAAGAAIANMTSTWGYPVCWDGRSTFEGQPLRMQSTPRQEAGCIAVNREGRRFMNAGVCYMDVARVHRTYDPVTRTRPNASPVWLVFDRRVRDRIELGDLLPGDPTPDWVLEAPTLAELATAMGVPPDALEDEVHRFSANARELSDPDFGRGTVWFEGFTSGGPSPELSLAPIDEPPYFALRMYDGALGTAGGLLIDTRGRVVSTSGTPIEGLYAAGNAAASIFGPSYPSGGVTLGPALTFGYLVGRDLAAAAAATARSAPDEVPA